MTAATTAAVPVHGAARTSGRLLLAGALAGPLFFASAIAQMLTREGFDITRHPISQLSTGDLGWIQILTFVLAGAGALALAAGVRRTLTDGVGRRALPPAVLSGVAALVLLVPMTPDHMSVQIAVNGAVAFTWTTVLAVSLRRAAA